MAEKRKFIDVLFGRFKVNAYKMLVNFKLTDSSSQSFTSFGNDAYASAITRTAIDTIARNTAKLSAKHVVYTDNKIKDKVDGRIQNIIAKRPNELMDGYTFLYKVITQLYNKNNAFVLIDRDALGKLKRLVPISYSSVQGLESESELFLKFLLNAGTELVVPYADVIHLRRFFYDMDLFGEDNDALLPTLDLIQTMDDGVANAILSSANIRGILKAPAVLNPDDLVAKKNDFVTEFLSKENNGGIVAIDSRFDYTPIKSEPMMMNEGQRAELKDQVYDYFNINDDIVKSKWDENTWNAFYEGVIEPLAIQMSLEFTQKIFTEGERSRGNQIFFEANRLAYASNDTKVKICKEIGVLGILTINEMRDIFNLAPVVDGDVRLQTLNVVQSDKVNEYQGVKDAEPNVDSHTDVGEKTGVSEPDIDKEDGVVK